MKLLQMCIRDREIAAEIQAISSLDSGSEKKSKAIEDLAKLYRLRIEESKNELDAEDKRSQMCIRDRPWKDAS